MFAALLLAALLPSTAFAIAVDAPCTHWTASGGAPWFPTPAKAAEYMLNCCSGYAPAQLPVSVASCTTDAQGPVFQNCTGHTALGQVANRNSTGYGAPGANVYWLGAVGHIARRTSTIRRTWAPPARAAAIP
jgi:hypothetical protein